MRVVVYDRYGPPEVLRQEPRDKPEPKAGEIRIRIRAVEVTKGDCELRSFRFPVKWFAWALRLAWGVRRPRASRRVLGGYFAGEIDGLAEADVAAAMRVGIEAGVARGAAGGLLRIAAGNYGGKLGPFHFHLHKVLA